MKTILIILILVRSLHALASIEEKSALDNCRVCHELRGEQGDCVRCHSSRKTDASWSQLYHYAPSFSYLSKPFTVRYNLKGLRKYLTNPVKRTADPGHMFPVKAHVINKVIGSLATCQPEEFQGDIKLIKKGKMLYEKFQCHTCHEDILKAPRLRIGMPLLSFYYWQQKLQGVTDKYYKQYSLKMPTYKLTEQALKAIYSYAAFTESPRRSYREEKEVESSANSAQSVLRMLHRGGCVHCHFASMSRRQLNQVLGGEFQYFQLAAKNGFTTFDLNSLKAYQMDEQCNSSPLINALEERVRELQGLDDPKLRGMPLTLPAFHPNEIQQIRKWSMQGCKFEGKNLCQPC